MIETKLETAEDKYRHAAEQLPTSRVAEACVLEHWKPALMHGMLPPTATLLSGTVHARAEHGRWLADCPFCASAQVTSPNDKRFFCVECSNAGQGGWVKVEWPAELHEIESMLAVRHPLNQNWSPGESLDLLQAENASFLSGQEEWLDKIEAEHGVGRSQAAAIRSVRDAREMTLAAIDGGEDPSVLSARGDIAHDPALISDETVLPKDED